MSKRVERARHLCEQLVAVMDALGVETRGPDVVIFLDRLARLEAYPAADLAEADAAAIVAEGRAARAEHAAEMAHAAVRALDLDRLLSEGRHLPPSNAGCERDGWLRDVLLLATVAPWLPAGHAEEALAIASAIIEADAEAFLDASVLASDRRALEAPEGLGAEARAFLDVLTHLPLVVAFDRTGEGASA